MSLPGTPAGDGDPPTSAAGGAPGDVEDYARANPPTVSLAGAIRRLLPNAEVTAVAGTDRLPAVLTAYYGGPHQGTAIAEATA